MQYRAVAVRTHILAILASLIFGAIGYRGRCDDDVAGKCSATAGRSTCARRRARSIGIVVRRAAGIVRTVIPYARRRAECTVVFFVRALLGGRFFSGRWEWHVTELDVSCSQRAEQ
jgi:hypothetical protein